MRNVCPHYAKLYWLGSVKLISVVPVRNRQNGDVSCLMLIYLTLRKPVHLQILKQNTIYKVCLICHFFILEKHKS